jgi:hypothetical protein
MPRGGGAVSMHRKRTDAQTRVLKNAAFFRTRPEIRENPGNRQKVRKSDFPRKRSHFRKKDFRFVSIKKNSFLANYFGELKNGHTFYVHFWKT